VLVTTEDNQIVVSDRADETGVNPDLPFSLSCAQWILPGCDQICDRDRAGWPEMWRDDE